MRLALVFAVVLLTACKVEPQPGRWNDHLDPYMAAYGYTMGGDGETILKDGYPVWLDAVCISRGCFDHNRPLVPGELREGVRKDFFAALDAAQHEYVADVSKRIGIEPIVIEEKQTQ